MLIDTIERLLALHDFETGDFSDDYLDGPLFEKWCVSLLLNDYDSFEIRLCAGIFCVKEFRTVLKQLKIQLPNPEECWMLNCAKILLHSSAVLTQDISQMKTDAGGIAAVLTDDWHFGENGFNDINLLAMDLAYNTGEYYQDLMNALLPADKSGPYHSSFGHDYLQELGRAEIERQIVALEDELRQNHATLYEKVMAVVTSYKIVQQPAVFCEGPVLP